MKAFSKPKTPPMTNNSLIAKWTGLRHLIPAAFAGKPITGTGWVFRRVGIAQFLVYPFLRWLSPGRTCIYEIKFLLLPDHRRMKENDHPLFPGCKLTSFTAIILEEPDTDLLTPISRNLLADSFYLTKHSSNIK